MLFFAVAVAADTATAAQISGKHFELCSVSLSFADRCLSESHWSSGSNSISARRVDVSFLSA